MICNKNILSFILFILIPLFSVSPQNASDDQVDIDSLFNNAEDITESPSDNENDIDLLNELVQKNNFTLKGNFRFAAGYSPGWSDFTSILDYDDMPVFDMSSALSLDFQISPDFRVFQTYSISFPEFKPGISEFFADYDIADKLFLRLGRQNLTWGISRNFPFTNLPARLPDNFGIANSDDIEDTDSYALKVNIPVGIGGFEALAYTRNGYFVNPDAPALNEIGLGSTYNLAFRLADFTLGSFYHDSMNFRSYYSISTTLFKDLETYSEGLVSLDLKNDDTDPDSIDLAVNIGFYKEFYSGKLMLNGEYYYNGEETELDYAGSAYPLFYGHNIAMGISSKLYKNTTRLYSQLKYNLNDNSGVIIPGFKIDGLQNLSLVFAVPIVIGPKTGGYFTNNPDTKNRQISVILSLILSGKI